jgi:hypothetical protein
LGRREGLPMGALGEFIVIVIAGERGGERWTAMLTAQLAERRRLNDPLER